MRLSPRLARSAAVLAALSLSTAGVAAVTAPVQAAKSSGCTGAGWSVLGKSGTFNGTVAAPTGRFTMQGRYTQFTVDPATFAVYDQAFTGAANASDLTGGRFTPIYASRVPNLRGSTLTSPISLEIKGDAFTISRSGPGVSMTLSGHDCATGGIFQMEPERSDGTRTRIVHTLAPSAFYFDNPNFRARLGQYVGADCTNAQTGPPSQFCVRVTPRVNIGNDVSPKFVLRDSPQVATRVKQASCGPDFTNTLGLTETADQCGGESIWDVASGGRMGMVTGEDGTEVANPSSTCTHQCQAQDQVRGRLVNLGFPFPVPTASRLTPRTSPDGHNAPLTAP